MLNEISKIVKYEFSETGDFVDITSRLSYMNDYNLNGFMLKTSDDEEKTRKCIASLVNTPVVAYYNSKIDDFEGHKVIKTKNGLKFGTQAVGTHIDSWVQNEKVKPVFSDKETELPCIYGKARIWASRFPKYYDVLKKRLEKDEMYTSWELNPITLDEDTVDNSNIPDPRSSDEWLFLGNCLLGSSYPAYGKNSKVLEMSSLEDFDIELSEALSQDILALSNEDEVLNINSQEGGKEMSKQKEQSALSMVALEQKLWEKINSKGWSSNPYYSIMNIYPEDHKVLCRDWDKTDEELMVFTYSVDESDEVSIGEGVETKLSKVLAEKSNVNIQVNLDDTAKLLSEREIKIKELDGEISTIKETLSKTEKELAEAGIAISDLTKEKENLEAQVSELTPFKEKVQEMEQAELDRQLAEKKEELKKFALEDNLIEEAELESDENIVTIFSELTFDNIEVSQEKIELIKGRKALQKYKEGKDSAQEKELETSTLNTETQKPKSNLNSDSEGMLTAMDIVKMYIKN